MAEIYSDITDIHAQAVAFKHSIIAASFLAFLAVFVVLTLMVNRTDRLIGSQHRWAMRMVKSAAQAEKAARQNPSSWPT